MGESEKLLEALLQVISRIPWRLIFNSSIAALSFSIIHYVFYMRYFGGDLLLLYPGDFYFQFCFLFFMHFASATLLGNIAFYTANYAIVVFAEDILQLHNAKSWRRLKLVLYKMHRRKIPRILSIGILTLFFFCLTYLGFFRGAVFIIVVLSTIFLLSFLQEHRELFKLANLRLKRKKADRIFTAERLYRVVGAIATTPRFRNELFNIRSASLVAVAAPVVLLSAALSGQLRASNIADNIKLVISKDGDLFSGVIYASSSTGIMVYTADEKVGVFLPAGTFTAQTVTARTE